MGVENWERWGVFNFQLLLIGGSFEFSISFKVKNRNRIIRGSFKFSIFFKSIYSCNGLMSLVQVFV